jgi:hypothetical protein
VSVRGTPTFDATDNQSLGEIARPRFTEVSVWPPLETCTWPPNRVLTEPEFIEYSGWNNLEPSQPAKGPMRFDPTTLIEEYRGAGRKPS